VGAIEILRLRSGVELFHLPVCMNYSVTLFSGQHHLGSENGWADNGLGYPAAWGLATRGKVWGIHVGWVSYWPVGRGWTQRPCAHCCSFIFLCTAGKANFFLLLWI